MTFLSLGQLLEHRRDLIARPAAHFLIDAANVFAQQTDAEQGQADQQERDGKEGEQPPSSGPRISRRKPM